MNEKTRLVFIGWLELTDPEKENFASAVNDFRRRSSASQRLTETLYKEFKELIVLGPTSTVCPCCGR